MVKLDIPLRAYWQLLRRYLVGQRGAALLMAILLLANTGMGLAGPQVVRTFIDSALAGAPLAALIRAAILFLAITLAGSLLDLFANYHAERVAWVATNALCIDLVAHLVRLDLDFHKQHPAGELIERVDGDVEALAGFLSSFVVDLVGSLLLLIGILVIIFAEDLTLGLLFVGFSLLALILLTWAHRFAPPHWRAERECSAAFFGFLGEMLTATEDLRACGAAPYAMRRYLLQLRAWRPVALRAHMWGNIWMVTTAAMAVGQALVRGLGGPMFLSGALSLGTLYMLAHYLEMLIGGPINDIRWRLEQLQHAQASIARVRALLDTPSRLDDGTVVLPPGPLAVVYDRVSFAYEEAGGRAGEGTGTWALRDLSFSLAPGRVLGLLGRTGSGKTTVARLLYRFHDPQRGTICLGGADLRQAQIEPLRARIGLVTQDVQLFRASLRDNLTFFDPHVADADLIARLEALGLGRWLERLPHGLDTPVSNETLSAGEAQLVALTRVYLKDPDLVILDEASSRIDPATEALLGRALDRLLRGRSAVIIAHRLATVARADEILILEHGRAIEHGERLALAADPGSHFSRLLQVGIEEVLT
jgi:ATP-binding cassette subfamily B protein